MAILLPKITDDDVIDSWSLQVTNNLNGLLDRVERNIVELFTPSTEADYNSIIASTGDEMFVSNTISLSGGGTVTSGYYKRNIANTTWVNVGSTLGLT